MVLFVGVLVGHVFSIVGGGKDGHRDPFAMINRDAPNDRGLRYIVKLLCQGVQGYLTTCFRDRPAYPFPDLLWYGAEVEVPPCLVLLTLFSTLFKREGVQAFDSMHSRFGETTVHEIFEKAFLTASPYEHTSHASLRLKSETGYQSLIEIRECNVFLKSSR